MLHNLRGDGFDCLSTLISIKMEHPRPLQVCAHVCIIFAHTGAGVLRVHCHAEKDGVYHVRCFFRPKQ